METAFACAPGSGFLGTRLRAPQARSHARICAAAKRPGKGGKAGKAGKAGKGSKAGGTAKKPAEAKKPAAKKASAFGGMGAGPGRKVGGDSGGGSVFAARKEAPESEAGAEEEGKIPEGGGTGVLGKAVRPGPPAIPRKTAADFVAEGVVDDVDEVEEFVSADIRFAVDDVRDPFKLKSAEGAGGVTKAEKVELDGKAKEKAKRVERNAEIAKAKAKAALGELADAVEDEQEQTSVGKAGGDAVDIVGDGGVSKRVLLEGSGGEIAEGATVTVEYAGRLADGKEFDSSAKRPGGFSFVLGEGKVIKGWEAAVATMRVGEKAEIVVGPAYGYGRRGMPPVIPGSATLTFDVEVVDAQGGLDRGGLKDVPEFNPEIARTVEDIDADYVKRLETQKERRSKMTLLEKFYIISPFASQTGERPPWYLNPLITFSIVFVVVALSFYVVVASDGVHQGYVKGPVDVNPFNK